MARWFDPDKGITVHVFAREPDGLSVWDILPFLPETPFEEAHKFCEHHREDPAVALIVYSSGSNGRAA